MQLKPLYDRLLLNIAAHQLTVTNFAKDLQESSNPFHTLDWGHNVYHDAALLRVERDIMNTLLSTYSKQVLAHVGPDCNLEEGVRICIANFCHQQALQGAKWPKTSCSEISNHANRMLTSAYAEYYEVFSGETL